jgi:group I intron endonuclease
LSNKFIASFANKSVRERRETLKGSGIYQIRNIKNNKIYIGSSIDLTKRRNGHLATLARGTHRNSHLQNSYNKHGKESFVFEVLEEVKDLDTLIEREQHWIDCETPEYNIASIAGSRLGVKHSKETRKKISEARKGKFTGEKNSFYGKKHSKETRKKISEVHRGKIMSEEAKKKISRASKGKETSVETKRKISKALKGRKISEESKRKISESKKGENHPKVKLTWKEVREIREKYNITSYGKLASEYGVTRSAIQFIVQNRNWYDPDYTPIRKRNKPDSSMSS